MLTRTFQKAKRCGNCWTRIICRGGPLCSEFLGSDYPHSDPSREDQFVNVLNTREDLSAQLRQKIMHDNPRAFYGI
jgi:hypothetical protein